MAVDIIIASVARGHWERCEVGVFKCMSFCAGNPRVGRIRLVEIDEEPTTCARNLLAGASKQKGMKGDDLIFMIDNDHTPNFEFFNHAVNWLGSHPGPACIGSPYCGSGPDYKVQVVAKDQNGIVRRVQRQEAAVKKGTEEVMLIGTGVFAVNMHAFDVTPKPYFDYGYNGPGQEAAIQTDDFYFCSKLAENGGKIWCAWDHWSIHWKIDKIGKPEIGDGKPTGPADESLKFSLNDEPVAAG